MNIVIACSKNWFTVPDALKRNHSVLVIKDRDLLTLERMQDVCPDVIFFPHWNWVVPTEIHEAFTCIVFHTAPLPYGRGGSPIQNLILNGVKRAPVCALRMSDQLDAGPIYSRKYVDLHGRLSEIFSGINVAIGELMEELVVCMPDPKDQEGEVYYFSRRKEEDNRIPEGVSASDIYDRIRMLDDPDYPNSYILFGSLKIEFFNSFVEDGAITAQCRITECK
ncbi:formyltransferase family protein [Thalassospira sp.]|uniref:formyltransferase family protein n=1 Tax=Thalassospira sp. TaxID=1912094 RepID=UPI003AA980AA